MLALLRIGMWAAALYLPLGSLSAQAFPFIRAQLTGAQSTSPTSLQWGPDGRLYVAQVDGEIDIYEVQKNGVGDYSVTSHETIVSVRDLPNHNDNGALAPSVNGRICTGLLVVGTPSSPVIYITSSDPRFAVGFDTGLDTNSGVLTRLTWDPMTITWEHLDLLRGLPRNEENHASNGMALDPTTNTLYMAQGGHTNMGARSNNFAFQVEYALSGAILSIDLTALGDTTYEMPTLDDPRPDTSRLFNGVVQTVDVDDPWGGNNGENQAILDLAGPVQIYAPGFRNAYDLLLLPDGRFYTIDNGPNGGWGGPPVGCVNAINETNSRTYNDALHYIGNVQVDPPGTYYGGHPNLTRGDRTNTFNGVSPIPVSAEDPRECTYEAPIGSINLPPAPHNTFNSSLISWTSSTNGFDIYTASNFSGQLADQLIVSQYNGDIVRVQLDPSGTAVVDSAILVTGTARLLDVDTLGDATAFPGTIWIAGFSGNSIDILEPDDILAGCTGADDPGLDEDLDGYTNADELDAGSDPCSAASTPADADKDFISDLNDPDDDNDGIPDVDDPFATDPFNGLLTAPRVHYGWALGTPGHGILGLGFTGLMTDGARAWHEMFDPAKMAAGGAAGLVTVEEVPMNTPFLGPTADSNFQFGVDLNSLRPMTSFRTTIRAPFFSARTPSGVEMLGMQVGTGTQDDYIAIALCGVFGAEPSALIVLEEQGGVLMRADLIPGSYLGGLLELSTDIELGFDIDPLTGTFVPMVALDNGTAFPLNYPQTPGAALLNAIQSPTEAVAAGLFSTSIFGQPFDAIWDDITVSVNEPSARVVVDPQFDSLDGSTFVPGSFQVTNTSADPIDIVSVSFDLSTAVLPDIVFDPAGTAGDIVAKPFELNSAGGTGFMAHDYAGSFHNGVDGDDGFDLLRLTFNDFGPGETMTFSIDNDPLSIKGTVAPGPNEAGSISGLELIGSTVTVEFSDGTVHTQTLARLGNTKDGAVADVVTTGPAPTVSFLPSVTDPEVTEPNQYVRVTARPNSFVRVTRMEACLFIDGSPNPITGMHPGGYQIDPDEVNSITTVDSITVFVGPSGVVDVPVTLTRFAGDGSYALGQSDVTGINYIVANTVEDNEINLYGPTSDPVVFELVPELIVGPIYRVNTGGPMVPANDGSINWQIDTPASPSPFSNFATTQNVNSTTGMAVTPDMTVPASAPAMLFQSERFVFSPHVLEWTFPVPVGQTVEVNLYFAEIFFTTPGSRVFDVVVEGVTLADNLDLVQSVGAFAGTRLTTTIVSDGSITIQLPRETENPKISAIEIVGM